MFQNLLISLFSSKKNFNLKLSIAILIFFVGLRDFGGTDFAAYEEYFYNPTKGFFEIGFYYYTKFFNIILKNYKEYIFASAIITNLMLYRYLKNFRYPLVILGIYIGRRYIWHDFVLLRQNFAILIFALSLKWIENKNFKKYLIYILIATLFHSSAIILLPIYFINRVKTLKLDLKKIITLITIYFLSTLIINYLEKIVEILTHYFKISFLINLKNYHLKNIVNVNYFVICELLIILFLINLFRNKIINKLKCFDLYFNLQIFNCIILILFSKFEVIRRITEYFELPLAVLIGYLVYSLRKGSERLCLIILIFIYSIIRLYYLLQKFDGGDFLKGTWSLFS